MSLLTCMKLCQRHLVSRETAVKLAATTVFCAGLVRSGVAPDHPEVKSVENDFVAVANDARFNFIGNAEVGHRIPVPLLQEHYAGVVLATGAQSRRELRIPGANLKGIMDARMFVDWYNGHPGFTTLPHGFHEQLPEVHTAVIIGNGNVALDCARMLVKQANDLAGTDIAQHALDVLRRCGVQQVHVLGRRGAVQAAFTIKELRELTQLPGVAALVHTEELQRGMTAASQAELDAARARKRQDKLLQSLGTPDSVQPGVKQLHLRFCQSPVQCLSDADGSVRALEIEATQLEGAASEQKAVPTGQKQELPCQLVLSSIGYSGVAIPGVPFDASRGVVPSTASRVVDPELGGVLPGLYVTGWLRRGPSGIIGTNISDAKQAVAAVLQDVQQAEGTAGHEGVRGVLHALGGGSGTIPSLVSWAGAKAILSHEETRGAAVGKPREKLTDVQGMMQIAADCPGGVWATER